MKPEEKPGTPPKSYEPEGWSDTEAETLKRIELYHKLRENCNVDEDIKQLHNNPLWFLLP